MAIHQSTDWAVILLAGASLAVLILIIVVLRERSQNRVLKALLGATDQPVLFYDERGRLLYISPGIVLFDRQSLKQIARAPERPMVGQASIGEIVIDFNRYRYQAKLLEYKPGTYGLLVRLEYQGSVAGNKQ